MKISKERIQAYFFSLESGMKKIMNITPVTTIFRKTCLLGWPLASF